MNLLLIRSCHYEKYLERDQLIRSGTMSFSAQVFVSVIIPVSLTCNQREMSYKYAVAVERTNPSLSISYIRLVLVPWTRL